MDVAGGPSAQPAGPGPSTSPEHPPVSISAPQGPAAAAAGVGDVQNGELQGSATTQQQARTSSLPHGLARRLSSTHYWLQDPTADAEDMPASVLPIQSHPGTPTAAMHAITDSQDGSEAESDIFGDSWASGSPDLRQGLLHGAHTGQHKQRRQHSSTGRHGRPSGHQQHHGRSSRLGGSLLAGLFGRRSEHSTAAVQQQADLDPTDAAAVTADLLETGGSLTFDGPGVTRTRVQEAAAAAAAATAAATIPSSSSTTQQRGLAAPAPPAAGTDAVDPGTGMSFSGDPVDRCFSEPAARAVLRAAQSGQLNEEVFSGHLGAGIAGGAPPRRSSHSISLGQMSAGKRRWQSASQKVIAMKHITSSFRPGALQGLDVKRHCYDSWFSALHTDVNITVVDYNKDQVEVATDINNAMLPELLKVARPEWSKVRWINVQGLSWDVITTLAVAFDLHPLSVEDIVHIPQRIKADYYPEYLYASVIMLSVDRPSHLTEQLDPTAATAASTSAAAVAGSSNNTKQQLQHLRRTTSSVAAPGAHPRISDSGSSIAAGGGGGAGAGGDAVFGGTLNRALRARLFGAAGAKKRTVERRAAAANCPALLQPMQPTVEQASMFLFRDGTLITMFQSVDNDAIARRLLGKLEGFRSLLTDSQDASYLFNAVLDAVVDHTLPLVQVYSSRIATLESRVLLEVHPHASLTKELHLLSNDLKLLRRTLVPTQHLVHKLQSTHDKDNNQGFLSPLTVLYLSDVYDHISTVVEDMVSLAEDAKDLIDLIFNTIAHNNNASMQLLAVVSTIMMPLAFLTGIYGTNFEGWFPEIHWQYGYLYFWGMCFTVTVCFSALLQRLGMFDLQ